MAKFDDRPEPQAARPMQIGDVRSYSGKDKNGETVKTIEIRRTARPYVYDLCDAYNKALPEHLSAQGMGYFVTDSGEVRLGYSEVSSIARTKHLAETAERQRLEMKYRKPMGAE